MMKFFEKLFRTRHKQHFVSLGTFCISAELLQRAELRSGAYPFDWMFCSVRTLAQIIDDDFAEFLNLRHLVGISDEPGHRQCMHALYDGVNPERPSFAHRNPILDDDRAYYLRAIDRFRHTCREGATFFLFEEFGEIESEFHNICTVIDRNYPQCRLIAVRHITGERSLTLTNSRGSHQLWTYVTSRVIGGVRLENPDDETYLIDHLFKT